MPYEFFEDSSRTRFSEAAMTINGQFGRLAFNSGAVKKFRDMGAKAILLAWDADTRSIAVKPVKEVSAGARELRFGARDPNNITISARPFLEWISYTTTDTRTLPMTWNEDQELFEVSLGDKAPEKPKRSRPKK